MSDNPFSPLHSQATEPGNANPYAPTAQAASPPNLSGPEAIRNEHLSHEASVQSIGILYLLGAVFLLIVGTIALVAGLTEEPAALLSAAICLGLGIVQFLVGIGLRRLSPVSRIPGILLSVIGLIAFPIGTIINGYILYLLLSKKGVMVFSDEYKSIIQQTPHIKYKTSIVVWIFLGLLLLVVALGLLALLGSRAG